MTFAPNPRRGNRRIALRLAGALATAVILGVLASRGPRPAEKPSLAPRVLTGHTQFVSSVAFSPRGRLVAAGSADGTVRVFPVNESPSAPANADAVKANETARDSVRTLAGAPDTYWVAFNPRGRILASAGQWPFNPDQHVVLWDTASGNQLRTLDPQAQFISSIAWSPDGRTLAAGIALHDTDSAVILWDAASGREISRIAGYSVPAFRPDGRMLAAVNQDGAVGLFPLDAPAHVHGGSAAALAPARELRGKIEALRAIAFSADGHLVITVSDSPTVQFWNADTGALEGRIVEPAYVSAIAVDPRGGSLAVASEDNVRVHRIAEENLPGRIVARARDLLGSGRSTFTASGKTINCVAFSPDGAMLAAGSTDGSVTLWPVEDAERDAAR